MAGLRMIKKGAEAELYRGEWMGYDAIFKRRIPKTYRNHDLDHLIRSSRTSLEAKLLSEARRLGVPTPVVYMVDMDKFEIVMSYIDGLPLKNAINSSSQSGLKRIFEEVGGLVGLMHSGGIVHGDLTTSNMILKGGRIFFIDFGLGGYDLSVEARGVDIHLMRRTLESSHHRASKLAYSSFVAGYTAAMGTLSQEILRRVGEIRRRGRYVEGKRCTVD